MCPKAYSHYLWEPISKPKDDWPQSPFDEPADYHAPFQHMWTPVFLYPSPASANVKVPGVKASVNSLSDKMRFWTEMKIRPQI